MSEQYVAKQIVDDVNKCWEAMGFRNDRHGQSPVMAIWFHMQQEIGEDRMKERWVASAKKSDETIAYLKEQIEYLKGEIRRTQERADESEKIYRANIQEYRDEIAALNETIAGLNVDVLRLETAPITERADVQE